MRYRIVRPADVCLENYKKTDVEGVLTNSEDNTVAFDADGKVIIVAAEPGLKEMIEEAIAGQNDPIPEDLAPKDPTPEDPRIDLEELEGNISELIWPTIDECIIELISHVKDYLDECPCKGNKSQCPQMNEPVGEDGANATH